MTKQTYPAMSVADRPAFEDLSCISVSELREIFEEELTLIMAPFSSFHHEYEVDRIIARIALCGKQDRNYRDSR